MQHHRTARRRSRRLRRFPLDALARHEQPKKVSVFLGLNMSIFSLINVSVSSLAHLLKKNTDKDGKEAKPGDLIEIIRGNYSHWAVYVGNGFVVHFGAPNAQSGSSSGGVDGIVMKEKLEDVAGKDKWRVNNSLDKKYNPLPPDEIVKKACSLDGVSLKYHLTTYNCEHFATEMRYGKAESRQVLQTVQSTVATVAGNAVGGIPGIIITLIGLLRQRSTS